MRRATVTFRATTGGWDRLTEADGSAGLPDDPRHLVGLTTSRGRLPLPPPRRAQDVEAVAEALDRLDRNVPAAGDPQQVGEYLFDCLADDETWKDWLGDEPLHLVIATDGAEAAGLHRLPWELARSPDGFLAARSDPPVAMCRSLTPRPGPHQDGDIAIEPTVLVVVGTTLQDATIQPATEYLALLETLRLGDVAVSPRFLLDATPLTLAEACAEHRPDVVHVIAHGGDTDGGFIELAPGRPGEARSRLNAEKLLAALESGGRLPRVLVLTACRTSSSVASDGTGRDAPYRPSIAAACVQGGVPIVAAMAGEVSSRACREFTFGFYRTLLVGGDVVAATAAGRRTAFLAGPSPTVSADWAYPAVFAAAGLSGRVEVRGREMAAARSRRARALTAAFRSPLAFCGRHDVLEAFRRLLGKRRPEDTAVLSLRVPPQLVGVTSTHVPGSPVRMGRSRALAQLGAAAALDGVAVAHVRHLTGDDRATSFPEFAKAVLHAALEGVTGAGATPPAADDLQLVRLQRLTASGGDAQLERSLLDLLEVLGLPPTADRVVAEALRLDLASLSRAVPATGRPGTNRSVVLIDDLHAFGPAAQPFLTWAVTENGVGTAENPVPLVFSYIGGPHGHEDHARSGAFAAIGDFVESRRHRQVDLTPFAFPEAELAYHQLLLGSDPPLVPTAGARGVVLEFLHEVTEGHPNMLTQPPTEWSLRALTVAGSLVPATDAERLAWLTAIPTSGGST